MDRDWKPVLNGETYCSPACGAQCKKVDYDIAVYKANKLRDIMGPDWNFRVWENLGWHYSVCSPSGNYVIHEWSNNDGLVYYKCENGHSFWSSCYQSPKDALLDSISQVQDSIIRLNERILI